VNGAEVLRADGSGRFRVDGAITIESAPAVLASGSVLLAAAGNATVEIDLAGLTDFDSAAIGVFFEWQRRSADGGSGIRYSNPPPKLATLAALYGVDALLLAPAHV
jgi:phospholipid transport system transporter-binding protein